MSVFKYLSVITFFIGTIKCSSLEYDGWVTIKLQHALTPGIFTDRGNITIQSLRLGQSILDQNFLTDEDQIKIRDLAASNEYYQLKSIVTGSDGKESQFLSTVKACMLAEAELDDRLSVSLDYLGRVIGVTLIIASTSTCEGAVVSIDRLNEFTTNVYVRHTETGPVPDTASYIQKIEREREAKERGEVKDNRTFLSKYWMYIVPVVILMMISSMSSPEAGGAPAQR